MSDWDPYYDIDVILDNIRQNSIIMSEYHKQNYYKLKATLPYFRIPTIIISAIVSVVSVGLQPFAQQGIISVITCVCSMVVGIMNSIELYMQIQNGMENELNMSKAFYILSTDIYKTLSLDTIHRDGTAKQYLDEKYSEYTKLFETALLINKTITDKLTPIKQLENKRLSLVKSTKESLIPYAEENTYDLSNMFMMSSGVFDKSNTNDLTNDMINKDDEVSAEEDELTKGGENEV